MTTNLPRSDDAEDRSDDHQQAVEACQHAVDALHGGDLSRARSLIDDARAVESAQYDDSGQARRETAYDCYE